MNHSTDLRERIATFLGFEIPTAVPDLEIRERVEDEGFVRFHLEYKVPDGDLVTAFMLVPDLPGPHPGVLALHQHNSQWELGKSEVCGLAGERCQAFAPALARRGICVLVPDAVGFESRVASAGAGKKLAPPLSRPDSTAEGWLQFYNQMCYRLVTGDHLMRKVLMDASCAIGVMASHGAVDPSRIGVVGHSFGGNTVLFLAALDERIRFACASGAASTYRHKMQYGTGLGMSLVIPGCANVFDIEDLVRCVPPRRILLVSSDDDPYAADTHEIVQSALSTFEEEDCAERLSHFHSSGPHALDQIRFDSIVAWMSTEAKRKALADE